MKGTCKVQAIVHLKSRNVGCTEYTEPRWTRTRVKGWRGDLSMRMVAECWKNLALVIIYPKVEIKSLPSRPLITGLRN